MIFIAFMVAAVIGGVSAALAFDYSPVMGIVVLVTVVIGEVLGPWLTIS